MTFINLLSNEVVVYLDEKTTPISFPSEGKIQVRMRVEDLTPNGIVKRGHWTHTRNLPEPATDKLYIVSSLVAMFELYANNRLDLVFPWGMVRSNGGDIVACRALCRPELEAKTERGTT